jgi:hypothetical protein
MTCRQSTLEDRLAALAHGLRPDDTKAWDQRFAELQQYVSMHGDAHCGFREYDSRVLGKWCKKQRTAHNAGQLSEDQHDMLCKVGFEFDAEAAEWLRWYNELQGFCQDHDVGDLGMFSEQSLFYLRNWCSVQRIARRSGVLTEGRTRLLDDLGFPWTAADPLS